MIINDTVYKKSQFSKTLAFGIAIFFSTMASLTARADNIEEFNTESFRQIKALYEGKPFRVELKLLGEIKKSDPDFPLVVISTDTLETREEALEILTNYELHNIKTWMFADAFVERLRFSVDPLWHGELPRSYFFNDDHSFFSHSGVLDYALLKKYLPEVKQ
jgi:hypothetical protein